MSPIKNLSQIKYLTDKESVANKVFIDKLTIFCLIKVKYLSERSLDNTSALHFFKILLSADQISCWSAWSAKFDLSNKYLTGPSQSIVLWSFRYVMPKYCQVIFQTNTWLAWAKILSANLSYEEAEVLSDLNSC